MTHCVADAQGLTVDAHCMLKDSEEGNVQAGKRKRGSANDQDGASEKDAEGLSANTQRVIAEVQRRQVGFQLFHPVCLASARASDLALQNLHCRPDCRAYRHAIHCRLAPCWHATRHA